MFYKTDIMKLINPPNIIKIALLTLNLVIRIRLTKNMATVTGLKREAIPRFMLTKAIITKEAIFTPSSMLEKYTEFLSV